MTNGAGLSVLTSAVPIILFALLLFVLLALAGVILLSLDLRYRAGTARRQARRWVASLNVWMTSFSAVFFLSFTLLLSRMKDFSTHRAAGSHFLSYSQSPRVLCMAGGAPRMPAAVLALPVGSIG